MVQDPEAGLSEFQGKSGDFKREVLKILNIPEAKMISLTAPGLSETLPETRVLVTRPGFRP